MGNLDLHGRNANMKLIRLKLLLCCLILFLHVNVMAQIIDSVTVHITEEHYNIEKLYEIANKLIVIREHQELDSVLLKQSLDALMTCRFFEKAQAEIAEGKLTFELVPAKYIRDIRIRREIPLFEDDVLNAISIYPGDVFYDGILSGQDSLITLLYEKEGFVSSDVKVESKEHRKNRGHIVNVSIRAGKHYRLKDIDINGNRAFGDFKLKLRMKTWQASLAPGSAGRFVKTVFSEDVERLVEFYKSKRFSDVKIKDSVIIDSSENWVHVILDVDEGVRYRTGVSKRRDRGYRKSVINKDITVYKTGNKNNVGVRRSVKAIEKRLKRDGFLGARVEINKNEVVKRKYTENQIDFCVKSGNRTTVSSINVSGIEKLDKKQVLNQMLHVDRGSQKKRAYNREKLDEDMFAIQMLYRTHGFLNANVSEKVQKNGETVNIAVDITEGRQTKVGEVVIDTAGINDAKLKRAISIKKGDVFNNYKIKQVANSLQAIIAEKGYPHAEIVSEIKMNDDSTVADVKFDVKKGQFVSMGDINFIGAFRTRDKVLNREMDISSGEPLALKKIIDSQKKLRDLGLFNSVRFRTIGLREKWDTVQVFVEVSEKPAFFGEMAGGYQSDKGPFLHAKVGDKNLFGFNKESWVAGELSLVGNRGEFALLEPRLFGLDFSALLNIFGEKTAEFNQDWSTTSYGLSVGLTGFAGKHLAYGLSTGYEVRRLNFESNANVNMDEVFRDERPRNRVVITPSFSFDKRDSFTRPQKGVYLGTNVDISKSVKTDLDNFVKVQSEGKAFFSPFPIFTVASVVRLGCLYPYGSSSSVPADQRFYLGGTRNVRGFQENLLDSIGGTVSISATVEARLTVGYNIEIAAFADMGRLDDDFISISFDQFRFSAGTGLRYVTPIGPVGVLYGWKLDRKPGEDKGAFHFSIGYTF